MQAFPLIISIILKDLTNMKLDWFHFMFINPWGWLNLCIVLFLLYETVYSQNLDTADHITLVIFVFPIVMKTINVLLKLLYKILRSLPSIMYKDPNLILGITLFPVKLKKLSCSESSFCSKHHLFSLIIRTFYKVHLILKFSNLYSSTSIVSDNSNTIFHGIWSLKNRVTKQWRFFVTYMQIQYKSYLRAMAIIKCNNTEFSVDIVRWGRWFFLAYHSWYF